MAKEGKDTTEYKEAQSATWLSIAGLILAAVLAYAPNLIEKLNGESKWAIIAGGAVGILAIVQSTLVKLGYIKSRTDVKKAISAESIAKGKK